MQDYFFKFLLYCLTNSQIWLIPLVHDPQSTYLTEVINFLKIIMLLNKNPPSGMYTYNVRVGPWIFRILQCSQTGFHPQEKLTKF
jgi:hypothetical protein